MNVAQLRERLSNTPITVAVLVHDGATYTGLIDPQAVLAVPESLANQVHLSAVALALDEGTVVPDTVDASELISNARVGDGIRNLYVVANANTLHGVVWIKDLVGALNS